MKKTIYLLFITLLLVSCSAPSCYEQSKDYVAKVQELSDEWDSANKLAGSTPRNQLVTPISTMQDIHNRLKSIIVPECAQLTHDYLMSYMDSTIDGFMSFMSQEEDSVVKSYLDNASSYYDSWKELFGEISTEP